jgi:hypothetical protein
MPRALWLPLLPLVVGLVVPARLVAAADAAPTPATEAAYREAATAWNAAWKERPSLYRRTEKECIAAWQGGDEVRAKIKATTPPPRFAAYHDALLAYVEAALEVSDECLVQPHGGPKWIPKMNAARDRRRALIRAEKTDDLDLPRSW